MKGKQLSRMLLLATNRHDGQFDKGGNPYILHPLKVMHYLKTDDEELMCIALGHDLVEDTFKCAEDGIASLRHYGMLSEYPEEGTFTLGDELCPKCLKPCQEHDFGVPQPTC